MKNYLRLLRNLLTENKKNDIPSADNPTKQDTKSVDENQLIINIANKLGLEFSMHSLKKMLSYSNRFSLDSDNMIFLYPPNDGTPTCPFEFFKGKKLIISNQKAYSEITNLDEILLQIVRIFDKSLDNGIIIDPYYFMLKLTDEITEEYKGNATLVITEKAIRNHKVNHQNFNEATKYFMNHFLDHFIGWNFGVSVNRNETLRNELEALNEKVIDMGIREYAGSGYEVYGTETEVCKGLQHYNLPITKGVSKKREN